MNELITSKSAAYAATAAVATVISVYAAKKLLSDISIPKGKPKESVAFDDSQHGGKLVAQVLYNNGVKFLFTLSGGHISPILVGAKQLGIRVIDVRHEVTAAFAADAVSRTSGVPGVACVTAGPGLSNTITAVKNAQMAQSPLILLGGASSDLLKGRGALQDIDQMALLLPHVKWAAHVKNVSDIVPIMEKAFIISQSGTPGPVFVEFPIDVLYPEKLAREWYAKETSRKGGLVERAVAYFIQRHVNQIFYVPGKTVTFHHPPIPQMAIASRRQISTVAEKLRSAKKPVIIVGSQAAFLPSLNVKQTGSTLKQSVASLNIPTYLSSMARGLLGKTSLCGLRHNRSYALRNADLVILAGVVCDFRLDYGRSINKKAFVVSVNRNKEDLYKNRTPSMPVLADPATFLHALAAAVAVPSSDLSSGWSGWLAELVTMDQKRDAEIDTQAKAKVEPINPIRLCQLVDEAMGDNSIIVADGGDFVGTASYTVRPRGPLSWLDPGAFGTLGVGGGFALGAKLCRPDAEVWIMFGDGACGYSLSEFDTFVRHNIPVIAIVGNDAAWQQILRGQMVFFGDDVACTLAHTDYHVVVTGFGAEGIRVDREQDIESALARAKAFAQQGKPVLVNFIIGKTDFRKDSIAV